MKNVTAAAIATLAFGCTEVVNSTVQPQISSYEASGLPRTAFIGAAYNPTSSDLIFEPAQATASQISAAPENVCRNLGGSVLSAENTPHPTPEFYPTARILKIICAT